MPRKRKKSRSSWLLRTPMSPPLAMRSTLTQISTRKERSPLRASSSKRSRLRPSKSLTNRWNSKEMAKWVPQLLLLTKLKWEWKLRRGPRLKTTFFVSPQTRCTRLMTTHRNSHRMTRSRLPSPWPRKLLSSSPRSTQTLKCSPKQLSRMKRSNHWRSLRWKLSRKCQSKSKLKSKTRKRRNFRGNQT